ncbi:MAG: aspartate kinase [Chitinophagales bacterium]|nr:aspartate kinase [Chitinophagales bacterium]
MKVFKFGGASIKDADSFRNVASIIENFRGEQIVLIVSALGKTTNALEKITQAYFEGKENAGDLLNQLRDHHFNILKELFANQDDEIFDEVNNTFVEIDWILEEPAAEKYDYLYDQIVSIGEMVSTKMLAAFLNYKNVPVKWIDVRDCIATDNNYREGKVNWEITEQKISQKIPQLLNNQFVLTQGFLGGTSENFTTTLGREGSDYSASIFAYSLNAESVTIWKDVAGVLNADPRYFPDAVKIDHLSYHEAIEMTYYGATVIHPKTIKPLQNKDIPLYVKCFLDYKNEGTVITSECDVSKLPPVLVHKQNQILISITPKDFSFIAEDNLSHIFSVFSTAGVKISLMQNSAVSFSVCADLNEKIAPLIIALKNSYTTLVNENLDLLTIRHYTQDVIDKYAAGKNIFLEQKSRHTVQLVMKMN